MNLSEKQIEFVKQLPICGFDATAAYYAAGYRPPNENAATKAANELLQQERIKSALTLSWHSQSRSIALDEPRIVKEMSRIAFSDFRNIFDLKGGKLRFKDAVEISDDAAASVSSVKITERCSPQGDESVTVEVRFWDKLKAIDMAARHLGLYSKDNVHTLDVNYTTELPMKAPSDEEWLAQNMPDSPLDVELREVE